MWIGSYNMKLNSSNSAVQSVKESDQGTYQGVVIHHQCPYKYCILKSTDISVSITDEQCAFNRTGILCGKCADGLSLILRSSTCLPCSNLYLGLSLSLLSILFFLFALNDLDKKLMLTAISCFFVLTLACIFHSIYRKWPLDIIESSCILNLGLLALVTNYVVKDSRNRNIQTAVVNVSVGAVFVPFIAILGYQAYKQLTTSVFWQSK